MEMQKCTGCNLIREAQQLREGLCAKCLRMKQSQFFNNQPPILAEQSISKVKQPRRRIKKADSVEVQEV